MWTVWKMMIGGRRVRACVCVRSFSVGFAAEKLNLHVSIRLMNRIITNEKCSLNILNIDPWRPGYWLRRFYYRQRALRLIPGLAIEISRVCGCCKQHDKNLNAHCQGGILCTFRGRKNSIPFVCLLFDEAMSMSATMTAMSTNDCSHSSGSDSNVNDWIIIKPKISGELCCLMRLWARSYLFRYFIFQCVAFFSASLFVCVCVVPFSRACFIFFEWCRYGCYYT